MKLFGTDVLALTCIVGGGLVATGVTATVLGRNTHETETGRDACAVAVTGGAVPITVSSDRIVLAPGVRVRSVVLADGSECGPGDIARIRVELDAVGSELEATLEGEIQARIEAEMKRLDATMEKLDKELGGNSPDGSAGLEGV